MATERHDEQKISAGFHGDDHTWVLFLQFILEKENLPTLLDKQTVDEHS